MGVYIMKRSIQLKKQDWKAFVRGYNGAVYAKNSYVMLIKSG